MTDNAFREDDEEDNDIGKHCFFAPQLYTQQLACPQQHYASSMCAYPFCAVHCIMYEKKKKISQLWKKKKQVIYCSLPIVHRLIISTEEEANAVGATGSLPVTEAESS